MKRTILAFAVALTLAGGSAAEADTFSPANSTTRYAGTLAVSGPFSLSCSAYLDITTNSTATAAVVSNFATVGGLCGIISFANLTYPLDALTATTISIQNIQMSSPTLCGPDTVDVSWSSTQIITFNSVVIEPPLLCTTIDGSFYRASGPALTIAP